MGKCFAARGEVARGMQRPHADYLAAAKRSEAVGLDVEAAVSGQGGTRDEPGEKFFDCAIEHNPADLESAAAAGELLLTPLVTVIFPFIFNPPSCLYLFFFIIFYSGHHDALFLFCHFSLFT